MNNLVELDNLYFVLENVLEFLASFVIEMTNEFLSHLEVILYKLYQLSPAFLFLILSIFWFIYFRYL
jgi:hypothetical protein